MWLTIFDYATTVPIVTRSLCLPRFSPTAPFRQSSQYISCIATLSMCVLFALAYFAICASRVFPRHRHAACIFQRAAARPAWVLLTAGGSHGHPLQLGRYIKSLQLTMVRAMRSFTIAAAGTWCFLALHLYQTWLLHFLRHFEPDGLLRCHKSAPISQRLVYETCLSRARELSATLYWRRFWSRCRLNRLAFLVCGLHAWQNAFFACWCWNFDLACSHYALSHICLFHDPSSCSLMV